MHDLCSHFAILARNNLWSNHRLHGACAQLSGGEYRKPRRAAFFGSIHGTLNHILLIDRYYLDRLAGRAEDRFDYHVELAPDLPGLTAAQESADRRLLDLTLSLSEAGLEAPVTLSGYDGKPLQDPVRSVLLHLFLHQVHHRGQVHALLKETPVEPPQLDEFFLSQDLGRREAELRELGLV
ncbi:MAG: DinB family protein [Kiloniellales bacterium]|nr:DinB family protein [Kiloniellales bacterium]